jgi:hypothetical protein
MTTPLSLSPWTKLSGPHRRKRRLARSFFVILGLVSLVGPCASFAVGTIAIVDCLLAIAVIALFIYLNYLLLDAFIITNDPVYVALLIALFFWPIITCGVSYYLTAIEQLPKKGLEYKIGGFGDSLTVGFMLGVEGLNERFLRPSLLLMLGTNTAFLVPILMMYRRVVDKTLFQGKTTEENGR